MLATPGERVRVTRDGGASERALLLCVHEDTQQAEVEILDGSELLVSLESLRPLEDFEASPAVGAGANAVACAEQCKAHGNALSKLRDRSAALEYYLRGSRVLRDNAPITEGARCLVVGSANARSVVLTGGARGGGSSPPAAQLRLALVLTREAGRCEVLYEPVAPLGAPVLDSGMSVGFGRAL